MEQKKKPLESKLKIPRAYYIMGGGNLAPPLERRLKYH